MRRNRKLTVRLTIAQFHALATATNEVRETPAFWVGIFPNKHDRDTADRALELLKAKIKGAS